MGMKNLQLKKKIGVIFNQLLDWKLNKEHVERKMRKLINIMILCGFKKHLINILILKNTLTKVGIGNLEKIMDKDSSINV
jgi:hypothetical protein